MDGRAGGRRSGLCAGREASWSARQGNRFRTKADASLRRRCLLGAEAFEPVPGGSANAEAEFPRPSVLRDFQQQQVPAGPQFGVHFEIARDGGPAAIGFAD